MKRIILFIFISVPAMGSAQSFFAVRQDRQLVLTAGTGTSTYYGELSNPGTILIPQPNVNVGVMKYFTPRISVRAELNWFILTGSDAQANEPGRKARGLAFRSNCFELSAVGQIQLYENGNRYYRRPNINFYAFGGVGFLYFNPVGDYQGKTYSLASLQTEGKSYSLFTPVLPFGVGGRLKITPNMNIAVEGGYRKTFTDYLDDVSSNYTAPSSDAATAYFQNPNNPVYNPAAAGDLNNYNAGAKRGDPSQVDSYFLLNVKLEYYLPVREKSLRSKSGTLKKHKSSTLRYNKRGGIKRK